MIVVDCTVIADLFIGTPEMQSSVKELLLRDSEWIAPVLWRCEFGHVLLKQVRIGKMTADLMDRYLLAAEKLIFESVAESDSKAIAALARDRELSFYDANYVWLGLHRGILFYSRDGKPRRKCMGLVQSMPGGE